MEGWQKCEALVSLIHEQVSRETASPTLAGREEPGAHSQSLTTCFQPPYFSQ